MTPFLGAAAGQAIEVSFRVIYPNCGVDRNGNDGGLGCFGPRIASLQRARNTDYSVSRSRDLLAHPPTVRDASHKILARKWGASFAFLTHWARLSPSLVVRAFGRDHKED